MLARNLLRTRLIRRTRQRTKPCKHAQNVGVRWFRGEISPSITQNEVDVFARCPRFEFGFFDFGIGRPNKRAAVPRDHEQHATVIGVRHHDRVIGGQETPRQNEMRAARRLQTCLRLRVVHATKAVREDACRVHDDRRTNAERLARFFIAHIGADDLSVFLDEPHATHTIRNARAAIRRRLGKRERHACIVELRIVVFDAAEEPLFTDTRNRANRLFAGE